MDRAKGLPGACPSPWPGDALLYGERQWIGRNHGMTPQESTDSQVSSGPLAQSMGGIYLLMTDVPPEF